MTAWSGPELLGHVAGMAFTAERVVIRTVPCACGGEITADVKSPGQAVLRHNQSSRHRAWWAKVADEWQGDER